MLKHTIFLGILLIAILITPALAGTQHSSVSIPSKDVLSSEPVRLYEVFGATAKSLLRDTTGPVNVLIDKGLIVIVHPSTDKSPTGKDVIPRGEYTFMRVGGVTAEKFLRQDKGNLLVDEEHRVIVLFEGAPKISI